MIDELQPLFAKVGQLITRLNDAQLVNTEAYATRLRRLRNNRAKRGLVNAIGDLSRSLFGTATEQDLQKVRNTVNSLVSQHNEELNIPRYSDLCE